MSTEIIGPVVQVFGQAEFWMGLLLGSALGILFGHPGAASRH
jgi:hypothetical protein